MKPITQKRCLYCKKLIPISRPSWWKKQLSAAHYARLKYCSYSCVSSMRNKTEMAWGRKSGKPDIGILNRAWSDLKSYKEMARKFGISYSTIKKWMGPQKYLLHPKLVYESEPGCMPRKSPEERKASERTSAERKEYMRTYYLKKVKPNAKKMATRRTRAGMQRKMKQ